MALPLFVGIDRKENCPALRLIQICVGQVPAVGQRNGDGGGVVCPGGRQRRPDVDLGETKLGGSDSEQPLNNGAQMAGGRDPVPVATTANSGLEGKPFRAAAFPGIGITATLD